VGNFSDRDRGNSKIGGRDPSGVDNSGDVAEPRGCFGELVNRCALGHVDGGGAYLETCVAHDLRRCFGVALAQVSQQHFPASADPSSYGLTDGSRSVAGPVGGDLGRDDAGPQRAGEEAPGSCQVARYREQDVDDLAMLVERPVQVLTA
jgi:hypothetical protein